MGDISSPEYLDIPASANGFKARKIAVRQVAGSSPTIIWLGGFCSDMLATKATYLDAWARRNGQAFVRFDYSGHGESAGDFSDCTISQWLDDVHHVIKHCAHEPVILVGSSMGGWLALLATRKLSEEKAPNAPLGLLLIAPAVDFTQELMWDHFSDDIKLQIQEHGAWLRSSAYSPEPTPITRKLMEDGRKNLLFGQPIITGCKVHILQGMTDPDVPYTHAIKLVEHLQADQTTLTLIKGGDHRLSKDQDLTILSRALTHMLEK